MSFTENSKRNIVILLGAPGSGKGTQAVFLKDLLKIPHISTGDLFRENISHNTPLGQTAKEYMDKGQLVPDSLVIEMLFERVQKEDASLGFLLDGFPRTLAQAISFQHILTKKDTLTVIELNVSDEVVLERIIGRAMNASLKRTDDTPLIVMDRLKVYHSQTKPLIQYYKEQGVLHTIQGEQSKAAISREIESLFS